MMMKIDKVQVAVCVGLCVGVRYLVQLALQVAYAAYDRVMAMDTWSFSFGVLACTGLAAAAGAYALREKLWRRAKGVHLPVHPSRYPKVWRDESVSDDYHGVQVKDPYRWLEDLDSTATKDFVNAQNALTDSVLAKCTVYDKYIAKLRKWYDYPKCGCPFKEGDRYYYFHNSGLQPQSVLYTQKTLDSEGTVFLDPNTLSADGSVALQRTAFSKDGKHMAYSLSTNGSDWVTIKVLRILPNGVGVPLKDELQEVKFTCIAWTHDNQGFFYNRYPTQANTFTTARESLAAPLPRKPMGSNAERNLNQELWYHRVGTPQSEDVLCYQIPKQPTWMITAEVSDDGRFVLLYIEEGCDPVNRLYYVDLKALGYLDRPSGMPAVPFRSFVGKAVKLVDDFEAGYSYVANDGDRFVFRTNLDAPNYKLVYTDVLHPGAPRTWRDLVPESKNGAVLEITACLAGDHLVLAYLKDVRHVLQLHSLSTGALVRSFPLPIGSISSLTGHREDAEFCFKMTGFVTAGDIYHVNLAAGATDAVPTVLRRTVLEGLNADEFITSQVFIASKDGTKVPMFVTHVKGLKLDQSNLTVLYGYGGFGLSMPPSFSVARLVFMKFMRGVFVQANLRGGAEYGERWHQAGTLGNKQNVMDDMQACAEFLINAGYTQPAKLAIQGGSNGGMLAAACLNQRPELFGCGIAQVGVMDMLRFHKFTIGHAWCSDFGCSDRMRDFEWLIRYSPLHNVRAPPPDVQFPSVLLLTADHDDRVVPLHSFKFAAELQHQLCHRNSPQRNPVLLRVDTCTGHGGGKPTDKLLEETATIYAFLHRTLGGTWCDRG